MIRQSHGACALTLALICSAALTPLASAEEPAAAAKPSGQPTAKQIADLAKLLSGSALVGHFTDSTYTYRFGPAGHDVAHAVLRDTATGAELGSDFFFPLGHGFAVQPGLGLTATFVATAPDHYRMTVRCPRFAQGVAIDAPGFDIDHNYFHLAPGGEKTPKEWSTGRTPPDDASGPRTGTVSARCRSDASSCWARVT